MQSIKNLKNMTLAAMFLALGLVLPFLTGQIREIGNMLLPMHIPVLLCGFLCGWQYGAIVGFITPLLRFSLFSMPPMPGAASMAVELATYGFVTGILYRKLPKSAFRTILSLVIAMVAGRIASGIAKIFIYGIIHSAFTWKMFISGAVLEAVPGIILQLILIPVLMFALEKAGAVHD